MKTTGWDYSDMVKTAKEHGGPDQYADDLVNIGREEGYLQGSRDQRNQDLVAAIVVTTIMVGIASVKNAIGYFRKKKQYEARMAALQEQEAATRSQFEESLTEVRNAETAEDDQLNIEEDN